MRCRVFGHQWKFNGSRTRYADDSLDILWQERWYRCPRCGTQRREEEGDTRYA